MSGKHNHSYSENTAKKIGLSIFLNILITVSQIIGGLISGSMALLSDALHNLSDVISLIISYVANKLSKRDYTLKQTFGYKRAEIIAAFINTTILFAVAIFLVNEAIARFQKPSEINTGIVIILAISSIIINSICVLLLQNDAKGSLNIKSSYLHLLSDVVTSFAVLLGGLAMKYFSIFYLDGIITIIIAIYLIFSSWKLFIKSIKVLMQFTPENILTEDICKKISAIKGIKNIHHIHIWQLNDNEIHFESHIDLEEDINISSFEEKLKIIIDILKEFGITHYNIQPEFLRDDDKNLISET